MATPAHCVACFEALDAHLNKRKAMSLDDILSSWASYTSDNSSKSTTSSSSASNLLRDPALTRVAGTNSSTSSSTSSSASVSASTPDTSTSSLPLSSVVASNIPASTPLFVTWNTLDSEGGDDDEEDEEDEEETSLRGCIGTFEPQTLVTGLPEYALISALHDSRFSPITRRELPTLQAAVTLLTDFEEVPGPYDWTVGVHGVRLSFTDKGRRYGSTYLPDVAAEQRWTKEEALFSLTRKAGWMGSHSRWKELNLRVTRYQGKKCSLNYGEFKKWRAWVDSGKK